MKILHVSDLHIGKEYTAVKEWRQAGEPVGLILEHWRDNPEKTLVLITGEIVDDGEEVEFLEAGAF